MKKPSLPEEGKLSCKLCGAQTHTLAPHLVSGHKISTEQYLAKFPGSPLTSEVFKRSRSEWAKGIFNPNFGQGKGRTPRPRKLTLPEEGKLKCEICGYLAHSLGRHVLTHGISPKQYQTKYNLPSLWSEALRAWKSAQSAGSGNVNFGVHRPMPEHVREILNAACAEKNSGENNPAKRPEVQAKMQESAQKRASELTEEQREDRSVRGRRILTQCWADNYDKMHQQVVRGRVAMLAGLLKGHPARRNYTTYEGEEIVVMGDTELAVCCWLDKNMYDWRYNDKTQFLYDDGGKTRAYLPDFALRGARYDFIEVKKHKQLAETVKKVAAVRDAGCSILVITERTLAKFEHQQHLPEKSPR